MGDTACWAGARGLVAPTQDERKARTAYGRGKRPNGEAGAGAAGPNNREVRREEKKFLFIFLNTIFNSKFNSSLNPFEVLIKPNHHKIKIQQHVCTNMLLPCDKF